MTRIDLGLDGHGRTSATAARHEASPTSNTDQSSEPAGPAIAVGKRAPDFRMVTTKDLNTLEHEATLDDYRGRWLVLFFYPADFTFICPTEILALNAALPAFETLDADVLGISTDSVHAHVAWMEFHIGALNFPLASDRTHAMSRAYGVLDEYGQSTRAVFLVDPNSIVRYHVVYDDRVGRSIDELVRVLTALQAPGHSFAQFAEPGARAGR